MPQRCLVQQLFGHQRDALGGASQGPVAAAGVHQAGDRKGRVAQVADTDNGGTGHSRALRSSRDAADDLALVAAAGNLGLVLGGSGNGEQMAANLVLGVRAALIWNLETARLARAHNDANVMALGARQHSEQEALELAWTFLRTPFSGDPRHARRVEQMSRYEGTRLKA